MTIRSGDEVEVEREVDRLEERVETRWGSLIVILAVAMLAGFIYHGTVTYFPTFLFENLGSLSIPWDELFTANIFTGMVLFLGMIGQYIGGLSGERRNLERNILFVFSGVGVILGLIYFFTGIPLIVGMLLFGLVYFINQPLINSLTAEYSSRSIRGRAYGIQFILSFGLGSLGSGLGGFIGERWDLRMNFPVFGAVSFVVFCMMLYMYLKRKRNL
jgi:MFS family permease